jgi:hypothetical protein
VSEYKDLLRAMGDHMNDYWNQINLPAKSGGVTQFWYTYVYNPFGYSKISNNFNSQQSNSKFILELFQGVMTCCIIYCFRRNYGYESSLWTDPPSDIADYKERRLKYVITARQCGKKRFICCLKLIIYVVLYFQTSV